MFPEIIEYVCKKTSPATSQSKNEAIFEQREMVQRDRLRGKI